MPQLSPTMEYGAVTWLKTNGDEISMYDMIINVQVNTKIPGRITYT